MKKKTSIRIIALVLVLLAVFILLTETNLTMGLAMATARRELQRSYPDFGTVKGEEITPVETINLFFPRYKLRSHAVLFKGENAIVHMEISAYFPFIILNTEDFLDAAHLYS